VKEHFGSYLVVDCESLERAIAIAARWPNAQFCAREVRPILDAAEMELGGRTPASRSCCADYEHFDACEDAAQEALLAAAVKWPDQGIPANPGAG
jgi:hypothetical protein